jgi:hypothetical protein
VVEALRSLEARLRKGQELVEEEEIGWKRDSIAL